MKAYIIAILVIVVLVSIVSVTMAVVPNTEQAKKCSNTPSKPVAVNTEPVSDLAVGTIDVSLGVIVREVATTAILFLGSVVVLKKNK
ncbi:MAG: hypothetical protein JW947_01810 [Sedimentisphaerales bacterium]|nr:hypothetical protein [Sedimentisphaerales bacterium]